MVEKCDSLAFLMAESKMSKASCNIENILPKTLSKQGWSIQQKNTPIVISTWQRKKRRG
jgi:hypothetical protein